MGLRLEQLDTRLSNQFAVGLNAIKGTIEDVKSTAESTRKTLSGVANATIKAETCLGGAPALSCHGSQ